MIARVIPFAAVALAFVVFACDQTLASQVATMEGIGPVKIGMTVEQAEHALGAKLDPISSAFGKECWVTSRSDKKTS
jgi:anaerobic C4-dicarboxylate transporter